MNLKLDYIRELPYIVISNFYTKEESEIILNTLINMNPYEWETDGSKTGGAVDDDKKSLKHNYCLDLDKLVTPSGRKYNSILEITNKIFKKEFLQKISDIHFFFEYVKKSNKDSTFLNYYEKDCYYDYHHDKSIVTAISTFYKEPKSFTGGEFYMFKKHLNLENGSLLLFPSSLEHKASSVNCIKNNQCNGRFSVAKLITCI